MSQFNKSLRLNPADGSWELSRLLLTSKGKGQMHSDVLFYKPSFYDSQLQLLDDTQDEKHLKTNPQAMRESRTPEIGHRRPQPPSPNSQARPNRYPPVRFPPLLYRVRMHARNGNPRRCPLQCRFSETHTELCGFQSTNNQSLKPAVDVLGRRAWTWRQSVPTFSV